MKDWIKNKLISFLGIDTLRNKLNNENQILKSKLEVLENLNKKVIEENEFILSQFNISADINYRDSHSWAVISIQGKPEYVRFVNLSNRDMRSVHSFLKQFEKTNRTVDSPMEYLKF